MSLATTKVLLVNKPGAFHVYQNFQLKYRD